MPRGITSAQREFAKSVFRDLEEQFPNQTEIGRLVGVDQSRVSAIRSTGKTSLHVLLAAATLANRPPEEISRILGTPLPNPIPTSAPAHTDPPVGTFLMRLRRLPGLEAWVEENPQKLTISQLAHGMAIYEDVKPRSRDDGQPLNGWGSYFDDALSGRLTRELAGAVSDAEALELAQMSPAGRKKFARKKRG